MNLQVQQSALCMLSISPTSLSLRATMFLKILRNWKLLCYKCFSMLEIKKLETAMLEIKKLETAMLINQGYKRFHLNLTKRQEMFISLN